MLSKFTTGINRSSLLHGAIILFILTMPLILQFNSIALILMTCIWFSKPNLKEAWQQLKTNSLIHLCLAFYLIYFYGILYSSNKSQAFSQIELKSTLLLLPVIFSTLNISIIRLHQYLNTFLLASSLAALAAIALMVHKVHFLGLYRAEEQLWGIDWAFFSYFLPKQIGFHPPYFIMYVAMSMFIAAYFIVYYFYKRRSGQYLLLYVISFVFLLLFAFLLASRTGLLAAILTLIIGMVIYLIKKKMWLTTTLTVAIAVATVGITYNLSPFLKQKVEDNAGVSQRQYMWNASTNLIVQNILVGIGPGDITDALVNEYQKLGFQEGVHERYNPHNQLLHLLLSSGLIGLAMYLINLMYLFILSYKAKVYLLTAFVLMFFLCGLTESNFEVQKGVVLFTFFSALLGNFALQKSLHRNLVLL